MRKYDGGGDFVTSESFIAPIRWNEAKKLLKNIQWASDVSIYQSIEFLTITGKGRRFWVGNLWNLRGVKEYNLIQYRDGEICAFAPLLINTYKKIVILRGHYISAGQLGFLYTASWRYEDFCALMAYIRKEFSAYMVEFKCINEKTLLCRYLQEYSSPDDEIIITNCVSICISKGYEKWFGGLSKSTKTHIKRSYNRVTRENLDYCIHVTSGRRTNRRHEWKSF